VSVKEKIKKLERMKTYNIHDVLATEEFIIVLKSGFLENTHDEKSKTSFTLISDWLFIITVYKKELLCINLVRSLRKMIKN